MKGILFNEISFNASKIIEEEIEGKKFDVVELTAAVGDIFFQETFVPKEVLREMASGWNNTIHDLNHMGTENLDYIVGFNDNARWDELTNSVKMTAHISHDSPKYSAWRNYMDIAHITGNKPNVSMDVTPALFKFIKTNELPAGIVAPQRYVRNGRVRILAGGTPHAVTTCLSGKCSDKAGCGIDATDDCSSGNCDIEIKPKAEEEELSPLRSFIKNQKEAIKNE